MHHTLGRRTFSLTSWCWQWWSGPLALPPRVQSRQLSSRSSRTPHTAFRSSWHCKSSGRENARRSGQARRYRGWEDLQLTFRVPGPPSKTTHTAGMFTLLPGGQTSTESKLEAQKISLSGDDICSDSFRDLCVRGSSPRWVSRDACVVRSPRRNVPGFHRPPAGSACGCRPGRKKDPVPHHLSNNGLGNNPAVKEELGENFLNDGTQTRV